MFVVNDIIVHMNLNLLFLVSMSSVLNSTRKSLSHCIVAMEVNESLNYRDVESDFCVESSRICVPSFRYLKYVSETQSISNLCEMISNISFWDLTFNLKVPLC